MEQVSGNGVRVLKGPLVPSVSKLLSPLFDVSLELRFSSLRTLGSVDSLNPLLFGDVVVVAAC